MCYLYTYGLEMQHVSLNALSVSEMDAWWKKELIEAVNVIQCVNGSEQHVTERNQTPPLCD